MSPLKKFKKFEKFEAKAASLISASLKKARFARILNNMASVQLRLGNIAMYHSLSDTARTLNEQSQVLQDNAVFLWHNAFFIGQEFNLIVAGSPVLSALTSVGLPFIS